ncbi:bifunctional metallophosphatase/5'-nucleotidase [Nocardioides gansuensis]|uniref:Bifunctional metallophosphatase/5'-nucleotidase n=1 Tax=Nocardioides gansuensis TaxID=2138300 RepID=A0A2T8F8M5_9ACTN|nr:5'-nucleotidase C-terminal domain-containing protein [Nocardioides gansuensis]PVG82043.1 bifunctional metallophosphatase/5'-nucleotidase [Nocardioides gansuensis]
MAVLGTASPAHAATVNIQILGTNDFHGRLLANGSEAGAAVLSGAVKQLEAENPNTVFAAAGDLIGASTFESFIQKDKPTIDALNEAGLDVSAVGNHELDAGYADLVNRVMAAYDATTNPLGGAAWQYIAANLRKKSDNTHAVPDRWIKDFGSVEVGFVGAVTEDLPSLVSPDGISSIAVTNIVNEVNASADALEAEGADVIVLLVHEGAPDTTFASATSTTNAFGRIVNGVDTNIDAIISGHTHLAYNHSVPVPAWQTEGRAVTTRPVVSAGQYGMNLNKLVFSVDDATGQVTAVNQSILPLMGPDPDGSGPGVPPALYPVDAETKAIVDAAKAKADELGARELGKITAPFNRAQLASGTENRGGESTLGNLVAEVQRWATSTPEAGAAQIAFMNPGGLRADMVGNAAAGYPATLTYKQAAVVQPFANTLVNMRLTGAQIKTVLEQQWQRDSKGEVPTRPFLRLGTSAGFSYTYDPARPEGSRITGMWLGGKRIEPATAYSVTVNSFLAAGGDNFHVFKDGTAKRDTGKIDLQAMVDYAAAKSPVAPDYTQHSVGVSFPAGAPAAYSPGDTVKLSLSSLAFSTAPDKKDTAVAVTLGDKKLGTLPVDNTLGADVFDEYGKAAVAAKVPGGTAQGPATLRVTGTTTGTTVDVPITVGPKKAVKIKVVKRPKKVVAGKTRARIVVKVLAEAGTPHGKVVLRIFDKIDKKWTAMLKDGRAKFKLRRLKKADRYKLKATYKGSGEYLKASKAFKLRVRRG